MPISETLKRAKEHAGNVFTWTVAGGVAPTSDDRADYEADWYHAQIEDVNLVRTVYGGTKAMRDAAEEYLPVHAAEEDEGRRNYEDRLKVSVLYNALKRTVGGLVGMVMRKDVVLTEDVPPIIQQHAENIDLQGRHIATYARDVFTAGMLDGHSYIHVEFPPVGGEFRTAAAERQSGVRPYWTHILKADAINAKWEWVNGEPKLKLFVYRERGSEDAGRFGQRETERYRVLEPGSFEVWERNENNELVMVENGSVSLDYIPVVASYVDREGLFRSCPPLLDLAYENISHWQIRSDYRHALKMSNYAMLFLRGIDVDAIKVGPNYTLRTKADADKADAKYLEPTGTSLENSREELKDIEARMASLGLQMLVRETRAAETAEAKSIDKAESDSQLATAARSLADSLENALQIHADYLGLGRDAGGSVIVNDDFRDKEMDARMLDVISNLVLRGQLSLETMWERMIDGEILPEDHDTELEQERVDQQGMEDVIAFAEARKRLGAGEDNGGPPAGPVPPE